MNNVKNVKYGLTPGKIEKKNHFLVKDLKQFSICIEQRKQNYFMIG